MFRVNRSADSQIVYWATLALVTVLLLATGATTWLVVEIRKEQRAIAEIVAGGVAEDIERLGTLPTETPWQLLLAVLVLAVLVITGAALVLIGRAYLNNLRSMRQIKMLAWDILASIDQGVITTDRQGSVTSINPRGEELLDLDFDCVGRSLEEICVQGQPLAEMSLNVLKTERAQHDHVFTMTRDGHSLQLRTDCQVLYDTGHETLGTVLLLRDVTERQFMEERMRRMERFMGLGTLAAGLHHEIKNPLTALALHIQLLDESLDNHVDQETAQTLGVLKAEVTRIAGVLESFRDYAATERLGRTQIDVHRLVKQTVELIRPQAERQRVRLVVSEPSGGPLVAFLDATRMEQVLLNLIMNALDAMQGGGTLSLAAESGEGIVSLKVSDTGCGIPDNVRQRVFDPYFTTKNAGSGMGLAVCDKIVRQHGGQIDVATGASGTTFFISLPSDPH